MGHFWGKLDKKYLYFMITAAGVYLFIKYALPLIYPFVIACFIVAPLYPLLQKIERKTHIGRGFLTMGLLFLCGCLLLFGIWAAAAWCIGHISEMAAGLDDFERQLGCFVTDCSHFLEQNIGYDAGKIETVILERVDIFIENFQVNIMPRLMEESLYYVKGVFSIGAFVAITFIATVLLAKDYEEITNAIRELDGAEYVLHIVSSLGKMVITFIRAQLLIMAGISVIAVTGLSLSGVPGAVEFGILAGLLDALPFIGTGIVLIPLAFWQLVQGSPLRAFLCVMVYVACALLREFLEPKLIGKRMGLLPVAVLASVYIGVKLYGLGGIFLGPLSLLLIKEVLSLYKDKDMG